MGTRAVLHFAIPRQIPLNITVHGVREATWGFGRTPSVRVVWRFASAVKLVTLSTVQTFGDSGAQRSVRVEVQFEGAPTLALEGAGMWIGPVPAPPTPRGEGPPRVWS